MVKNKVKDAVTFLQQCLIETGLDVSKIIIFGSQSRDNATEDSDIDIAIEGISSEQAGFIKEVLNEEIETLLDFDVLSLDELSNEILRKRIREEGMIIYERNAK